MVQVRKNIPSIDANKTDIISWIDSLPGFSDHDAILRMTEACTLALKAQSKVPHKNERPHGLIGCYDAGIQMASILANLCMDEDVLIAAVIYRSVREERITISVIRSSLGSDVAKLVEGVLRMAAISNLKTESIPVLGQENAQVENLRKMLVAMVDDVRVGLLKLAERTQAIRAVKNISNVNKQKKVAREVFDIYAPLAHRLGIGQIKWELEDVSFRYLEPEAYSSIASKLDERRLDRDNYVNQVVNLVEMNLKQAGIDAQVTGRAKHIYSIWRKMQRKSVSFEEVYDVHALRITVPHLKDCYASLGVVHTQWRNIPREFDDYIANPKENGYRSLHTAVIGPEQKVIEIQIRTHDMHQESELGVCAHWRYKGTDVKSNSESYEQKISWLRQVLEWHEEAGGTYDVSELAGELTNDFGKDRIYVFTPNGHIVDIPSGSTPVDFAYHIHTEVGHRCRGAKVDGRIVPLSKPLVNGQKIEIIKGPEISPNRDWLQASLGYLSSSRARSKVRAWFKKQARGQNIQAGRSLLERETKRLAINSVDFKYLTKKLNFTSVEDLYASLGSGDISINQIMRVAEKLFFEPKEELSNQTSLLNVAPKDRKNSISVLGVGNLLTSIAKCCKPVPGDDIAGYVTVGRGVTVHRKDCNHFLAVNSKQKERVIEVSWGKEKTDLYSVDILVEAYDRTGLLSDITGLLSAMRVNVSNINTRTFRNDHTVEMRMTLEIHNIEELMRILARLNNTPNIINATRIISN
jgi:GTP pyrophosphokinase